MMGRKDWKTKNLLHGGLSCMAGKQASARQSVSADTPRRLFLFVAETALLFESIMDGETACERFHTCALSRMREIIGRAKR
jgi:hypothetical protein